MPGPEDNMMLKDGIILEQRQSDDPMRPELRVLSIHPSSSVGTF